MDTRNTTSNQSRPATVVEAPTLKEALRQVRARYGEGGRRLMAEEFSVDRMVAGNLAVYEELVPPAAGGASAGASDPPPPGSEEERLLAALEAHQWRRAAAAEALDNLPPEERVKIW